LSLMAWCPDAEAARVDDAFVLRLPKYHGAGWLTALMAREAAVSGVVDVLDDPAFGGSLSYVPYWLAESLREHPALRVAPDRDNFDYVYDPVAHVAAAGRKYCEIRQKRRAYRRAHPEAKVLLRAYDAMDAPLLRRMFDAWASLRQVDSAPDTRDERAAFERLLARPDLERCTVTIAIADGQPIGFELDEIQPDRTAIGHFMKLTTRESGANEILVEASSLGLASRGIHHLNYEQDLGLPGLRLRKTLDRPAFLLEKYVVTLA